MTNNSLRKLFCWLGIHKTLLLSDESVELNDCLGLYRTDSRYVCDECGKVTQYNNPFYETQFSLIL